LFLVATVAFLLSGYRSRGFGYLATVAALMAVVSCVLWWMRSQRRRQAVIATRGVLLFRSRTGRPVVIRSDAVAAVVLSRVRWGRRPPPILLAVSPTGEALVRVWGAEWDHAALTAALSPLGIGVDRDDAKARSPRQLEARYPGSMTFVELHPFLAGGVIPMLVVVVVATVLALVGVIH
jgi:hypothetical protein